MMYRKQDKAQLTMDEFYIPFGDGLDANNRWVKIARIIPWDFIEEQYAKSFSEEKGRPSINSRIAFGAEYIKGQENLTDEGTVAYLCENPYAQYLVGLKAFFKEALFEASMMVHFRKRFTPELMQRINEIMYERAHPAEENQPEDKDEPPEGDSGNKGILILDATVAPADIKYPTDLGLVNDCRENTEKFIEKLWEFSGKTGHKTAYNRKKARRSYLKVAKQRKAKLKATRRAIGEQLTYVGKNLETLSRLKEEVGENKLSPAHMERLETIEKVYEQQRIMHETGTHSCPDRIVSLRQPHVRCIVRGKAGRPYEFGQKLHLSVVNGFTFIEDQSYDNYNEGVRLQAAAQRYKDRFGHYPEAILADTIYRNRENRAFCKEHGIRLSGPKLGRPRKDETDESRSQAYKDSCDRNMVESRNGIGKRRYGLDLIMAYLAETGKTEAAFIILAMNVAHLLRLLFSLFWHFLAGTRWTEKQIRMIQVAA
jgi:IS5 family transposase